MTAETSQLVKCKVINRDQQESLRLIERDNFDLWRYLMTTKHQMTIIDAALCMWVTSDEYQDRREIYLRAGEVESANRITLMMYDEHGHFNNTCRYAMAVDSARVEAVLISHIPEAQRQQGQFSLDVEPGHLVVTGPLTQLGLADFADTQAEI